MEPFLYETPIELILPGGEPVAVTRFDGASYVLDNGRTFLMPEGETPATEAEAIYAHIELALNPPAPEPVPEPTPAELLVARRAELKARLAERRWEFEVSGGITLEQFPDVTFHSSRDAQFNTFAAKDALYAGPWKTEQGTFVVFALGDIDALYAACASRKAQAYAREAELLVYVNAAISLEQLEPLAPQIEAFLP